MYFSKKEKLLPKGFGPNSVKVINDTAKVLENSEKTEISTN